MPSSPHAVPAPRASAVRGQLQQHGLEEGGGGQRGVRLPVGVAAAVAVVGDAPDNGHRVLLGLLYGLEHGLVAGVDGLGPGQHGEGASLIVVAQQRLAAPDDVEVDLRLPRAHVARRLDADHGVRHLLHLTLRPDAHQAIGGRRGTPEVDVAAR